MNLKLYSMKGVKVPLDFAEDYILENELVKLIPLNGKHLTPLAQISEDPEIWKFFFCDGSDAESLKKYIKKAVKNRSKSKEYPFVVFDKRTNQYAGTTRFYEYSQDLKTIKLGHTWYGKTFRGSGLNKQCKNLLFEFAFEKLQVERVGFGAYADNLVSIKALESVGCKKEGVLRNMFPSLNGIGRTDAILMSILREDWFAIIKPELSFKMTV